MGHGFLFSRQHPNFSQFPDSMLCLLLVHTFARFWGGVETRRDSYDSYFQRRQWRVQQVVYIHRKILSSVLLLNTIPAKWVFKDAERGMVVPVWNPAVPPGQGFFH